MKSVLEVHRNMPGKQAGQKSELRLHHSLKDHYRSTLECDSTEHKPMTPIKTTGYARLSTVNFLLKVALLKF